MATDKAYKHLGRVRFKESKIDSKQCTLFEK